MKKIILAILTILLISCQAEIIKEETKYPENIEAAIDAVYNCCINCFEIPSEIIQFSSKIETIRFCDGVLDPYGDILCEMEEYDLIEKIIWPYGYNVNPQ